MVVTNSYKVLPLHGALVPSVDSWFSQTGKLKHTLVKELAPSHTHDQQHSQGSKPRLPWLRPSGRGGGLRKVAGVL